MKNHITQPVNKSVLLPLPSVNSRVREHTSSSDIPGFPSALMATSACTNPSTDFRNCNPLFVMNSQECLSDKSSNVSQKKDKSSNDLQPPLEYRIGLSYFYNDP
jgi:hypothetical protein